MYHSHPRQSILLMTSFLLALLAMALFVSVPMTHAAGTVSVCDQAHLASALSGGGSVTFSCSGTITLTSTIVITSNTTVDGGQNVTISGNNAVRVFSVNSGITLNLLNLTVADGNCGASCDGGGINNAGTVNISNVILHNNTASNRGGAMFNSGSATLTNATVSGNMATNNGGGLFNDHSSSTLSNTLFISNAANYGGGMENLVSSSVLTNSAFISNTATNGNGGGMRNSSEVVCHPYGLGSNCDINYGTASLINVTFISNTAQLGGGIDNDISSPTLTNVTFTSNTATNSNGGGSMHNKSEYVCMHWVLGVPAGSEWHSSAPMVQNSILWNNQGGEIYNETPDGNPSTPQISNSVVQDGCPLGSICTNLISVNPLLGVFGNYGGYGQQTIPLLPGSPAIHATSTNCPSFDQRGLPRSSPCDMGAYESQGFTLTKTSGDNQSTLFNTPFIYPLSVTLKETGGSMLSAAIITFTAPTSNASITPPTTITATTNANGVASISITANSIPGLYNVTAKASDTLSVTFKLTNTLNAVMTVLSSSPNPSTFEQPVTLTATVTSTVGIPTGSVNFFDNAASIGSGTLSESGIATTTIAPLSVGLHPITAMYSGDTTHNTSISSIYTQTVGCSDPIKVSNANDSGIGSLRQAIAGICAGGTITFNGSYTIALTSQLTINKSLTIDGIGHKMTISGDNAVRVFNVNTGVTFNLQNLAVTNGNCDRCDGGGINNTGILNINNVSFSGNTAYSGGGGIYNSNSSSVTLTSVTFSGNSAFEGGGMYNDYSSPTLTNVTFSGNLASYGGGGMYNDYSSPTLTNVTFSGNSSYQGGGMYNLHSSPTLTNVTFSGNSATHGGGMYNEWVSRPTLTNVTFSGNSASHDGGGMEIYNNSSPTLTNVTFSGNSANYGGGIVNHTNSYPVITNTLLWDNTATISGTQILNSSDSRVTISNSVVQSGCPSQSTCTNINMDDPLLGTLGNYGGSTQTIPLLPGSSAINATSTNCPLTDQRGFPRSSPDCDIGSFESQGFTLTKSGGDNQLAIINTTFTNPLSVTLHETGVSVLPGAVITFTAPSSNQSITPPTTITATTNASGIASIPITANGNPGSYNATASTSGATSVTFALTNTVNTTTTLTSLPNPSTYGQAVIFTATVTSPVGTLTGSVNFFDNSTNVGSGTLNASGIATTTVSTLSAGPHPTITAQYLGNTGYLSSTSSNYSQTVNQANTTTSLTSSPNSSTFGQSITITATVSPSNATGTVQFYADGSTFGSPIALSSGKAVTTTTSLGVGSHSITTIYSGDANYNTSASSLITQIVNIASTTITLTSSPNPSQVGQSVTFTATVSIAAGARPIVRAPQSGCVFTGTIQFKDSSTNMGSSQSLDSNCQATYITNTLTAGNHPITAAYSGDVNSSSSTVTGFTQMVGNIIKIYFPFIRR